MVASLFAFSSREDQRWLETTSGDRLAENEHRARSYYHYHHTIKIEGTVSKRLNMTSFDAREICQPRLLRAATHRRSRTVDERCM